MRQRIRSHLTYANVVATLALCLVLGGGTALASYVISSNSQIGPNTVSGHRLLNGNHSNIVSKSINGRDVADFSGIDKCTPTLTAKFDRICAGSDGVARNFRDSLNRCGNYGLRLPSISEATTLMLNSNNVPGVNSGEEFWTDDEYYDRDSSAFRAITVSPPTGNRTARLVDNPDVKTVCVADPTN